MLLGASGPAVLRAVRSRSGTGEPWSRMAARSGVARIANPILSDLAFANLPWRAAVREAIANGRFPFWNRFVLGGTPLLAAAQAAIFHPSTWLGIFLPVPLSWTFSCTFTLFLALLDRDSSSSATSTFSEIAALARRGGMGLLDLRRLLGRMERGDLDRDAARCCCWDCAGSRGVRRGRSG